MVKSTKGTHSKEDPRLDAEEEEDTIMTPLTSHEGDENFEERARTLSSPPLPRATIGYFSPNGAPKAGLLKPSSSSAALDAKSVANKQQHTINKAGGSGTAVVPIQMDEGYDGDDNAIIDFSANESGGGTPKKNKNKSIENGSISGLILHPSSTEQLGRHHRRKGTIFGLTFNTLTNVMGAGVLSLPFATYNGSILISLFLLMVSSSLSAFSVYILTLACDVTQKFSYTECMAFTMFPDTPLRDGPTKDDLDEGIAVPDERLSRRRRRYITLFLELIIFLNGFGALTIYSRVIADSIPSVLRGFGVDGFWTESLLWLIMPGLIFFGLSCIRNMDELKWTSVIGFVTIIYIVLVVLVRYYTNSFGESLFPEEGSPDFNQHEHDLQQSVRYFRLGISCFATMSTYSLAFGYHFNVPYFYKELKDRRPAVMMKSTMISFPIITASYGLTGLFGYLTFGALVASSAAQGNIVNNYGDGDIAMSIGRLGLFFHFATVYPIISICCRRGLHRMVCILTSPTEPKTAVVDGVVVTKPPPGDPGTTKTSSIITEAFAIVFVSTCCAGLAPGIGIVVELVGTLFGTPLIFIFPGLIGWQIFHEDIPSVCSNLMAWGSVKTYYRLSLACIAIGGVFVVCGMIAFLDELSE